MSNAALPGSCRNAENGSDAKPFLSDVFPRGVCRRAESAGNGVLSSGEKNFSVHKTYMNFSRPRNRAPEAALYDLRGILPQNVPDTTLPDDDVYNLGTRRGRVQVDGALSPMFLRTENGTNATPFLNDVYNNSTRARKRLADVSLYGRSMVEMLGVLAIIGVLSVGAISGYQKAMFKYRLNKHAESVNILINNALQIMGNLETQPNQYTFYNEIFNKLKLLPDGMVYVTNDRISDIFNNGISIYHNNTGASPFNAIRFTLNASSAGLELCQNIVTTAKENSANLWLLQVYKENEPQTAHGQLYGDNFCKTENTLKCLKKSSLQDIAATCFPCKDDKNACLLFVAWQ